MRGKKILKGIGILFIVFLIVTSILIFMFGAEKKEPAEESSQTIHLNCKLNDKEYSYLIEIDENGDIVEAGGKGVRHRHFSNGIQEIVQLCSVGELVHTKRLNAVRRWRELKTR